MTLTASRAALVAIALPVLAACAGRAPYVAASAAGPRFVAPRAAPPVVDVDAVLAMRERLTADSSTALPFVVPVLRLALDVDVSPYESDDRVARYVELFTGAGRDRFAARLQRGARYDALIRGQLRAAGLPEDLTYLALVESGYDPHAVSRTSAVGMWQFMAETARLVRLRVDWWVDERRDPVRATDAAVRNLRWLRKEFGSMFLAAAAYNGGAGRVANGLARLAAAADSSAGETRFFALVAAGHLREETSNYVPQIIAAALVASEPERYGIAVRPEAAFAYDSVWVPPLVPLAAVAGAAGASREQMLDLNPHLVRGMTPPGDSTLVRVPLGLSSGFADRFADVPAADRSAFRRLTSRAGETLTRLAARADVPPAELRRYNRALTTVKKGKRRGTLRAGQPVRVPSAAVVAYARPATDDLGDGPGRLPALAASPTAREKPAASASRKRPAATKASKAGPRRARGASKRAR